MDPPPFLWDLRCPGVVTYQTLFDLSQHDLQVVPHCADIEEELRRVQAARQVLSRSPTYDEFDVNVSDLNVFRLEAVREPVAQRLEHVMRYKRVKPASVQYLDKGIVVARVDYATERFCPD